MNCNSRNQFFCCRCCDSRCWKLFWCNDWSWCRSPPPPHFCCCSRPLLECSARPVSFPLHLHLSSRWCRRIKTTWEKKIQQQQQLQYLDSKVRGLKMITTAKTSILSRHWITSVGRIPFWISLWTDAISFYSSSSFAFLLSTYLPRSKACGHKQQHVV